MCLPWPDPTCEVASAVTFAVFTILSGILGTLMVPEDENPPNPLGLIVLLGGIGGIGWYFTRTATRQTEIIEEAGRLAYPFVVLLGPAGIGMFFLGIGLMTAAATHVLVGDYA